MSPIRTILHIDMDAFFASVEQLDNPALRGKPVIVGAPRDKRGVVAAASYEARAYGVHSAMPSREAGRLCPEGVFVPPRMERYEQASRHVFSILERFTPLIEPLSIDEAFLDVTGATRLFGTGPEIARKIRAAIGSETGLTASVGVAGNKFLAKLGSEMNKPDGLTIVPTDPDGIRRFLAPLPVRELWGVGEVTCRTMEEAGLLTVGDLQRASVDQLAGVVGRRAAEDFKALAAGDDDREVELEREDKSMSRENTFDVDCSDYGLVESTLLDLVDNVGARLRDDGRYAELAKVKVRWKGFETITRQKALVPACCDDFGLREAAMALWKSVDASRPVRLIGFGVSRLLPSVSRQMGLFGGHVNGVFKRETLSRTVDGIRRRFGQNAIKRGTNIAG